MNVSGRLLNCVSVCVSPVFSSISLDLLPERVATLMVYEDVVEIVSDLQGKKKKSNKKNPNLNVCLWSMFAIHLNASMSCSCTEVVLPWFFFHSQHLVYSWLCSVCQKRVVHVWATNKWKQAVRGVSTENNGDYIYCFLLTVQTVAQL